jgi:Domain of unknown function (DUF5615)
VRLLLDEQLPAAIADALRASGHDVVAVQERDELCGLPDAELFEVAQAERRAIVIENVPHFRTLAQRVYSQACSHHGLIYLQQGAPEAVQVVADEQQAARRRRGGRRPVGWSYRGAR